MEAISLDKQHSEKFGYHWINGFKPENRGRKFQYECLTCGGNCNSTIPVEAYVYRYENCSKCGQKHLVAMLKNGYGPSSVDLLCILKVLPVFYLEQVQPEDGFIDPMDVPGYFDKHSENPASNFLKFSMDIAKNRNKHILNQYSDKNTVVKL